MKVELIHHTPLEVADIAIGKCWGKGCYEGEKMIKRMERVALKHKHESTIEHLVYSFDIDGISRACLQELARHRIASLSVKSTRYTLKELLNSDVDFWFDSPADCEWEEAAKFLVFTGDDLVDSHNIRQLGLLQQRLRSGISNDYAKYMLPEAFKTSLVWTINARSLRNFLSLRSSKDALWEIRKLAWKIYVEIPETHKFLFEDCRVDH